MPAVPGAESDPKLLRVPVWEDNHWRLTASLATEVAGFCYLEPKRHVRYVHELDGVEADTFGPVLARCSRVLKEVTGAELVFVYIFGGSFDHLHVHLAPYRPGGPLNSCMVRGEVVEHTLESGAVIQVSKDFPLVPEEEARAVAERLAAALVAPDR